MAAGGYESDDDPRFFYKWRVLMSEYEDDPNLVKMGEFRQYAIEHKYSSKSTDKKILVRQLEAERAERRAVKKAKAVQQEQAKIIAKQADEIAKLQQRVAELELCVESSGKK